MKKMSKVFMSITTATMILASGIMPANAEVSKYIIEDINKDIYEYQYGSLRTSYRNYILQKQGKELFDHYNLYKHNIVGFYDTVNGYVGYDGAKTAYRNAVMDGKSNEFTLNKYTESEGVKGIDNMPSQVKEVTLGNEGEIVTEVVDTNKEKEEDFMVIGIQ